MVSSSTYKSKLLLLLFAMSFIFISIADAAPLEDLKSDARCPVCGMFVAKFDVWITQIRYEDTTIFSFDGVKDMMAYYHKPSNFNGQEQSKVNEIWVKDYYSLKWLDARKAFFVIGSDVHGPMGHELIPFSIKAAAESFLADHHGRRILTFDKITIEVVDQLRVGNRMKNIKK